LTFNLPVEEIADQRDHFIGLVLQGKMPGVEEMKLEIVQVALVRMRAVGGKDLVVLAPQDQRRRLVLAKICLYRRIKPEVGAAVVEEVELNVVIARPVEQRLVVDPVIG
jgi:hypothetical protein